MDACARQVIGGFALVLFFAYSLSWIAACVGLNSKSPESAASFGFIRLFPLAFVSNAMVPTQHMPGWLQAVADWNPVSAVTAGPANSGAIQTLPLPSKPGRCGTRSKRLSSGQRSSWRSPPHWPRTSSGGARRNDLIPVTGDR